MLEPYNAKGLHQHRQGIGQLSVRPADADVLVLIRERTHFPRLLLEKLPKPEADRADRARRLAHRHRGRDAAGHRGRRGHRLAGGAGRADLGADHGGDAPAAAVHRQPQKHGAWQQSGLKAASMPPNFGIGMVLRGQARWASGATARSARWSAGYGRAFGMTVQVWAARPRAAAGRRPRRGRASEQFFRLRRAERTCACETDARHRHLDD